MNNSKIKKSGKRCPFRFSDMRIRTKLLAVIILIVTVFTMIVLTVMASFHRIETVLGGVIRHDMNNVVTNALTERELSSIVADFNLLKLTFFKDEAHLESEGERLLGVTRVLAQRVKHSELETQLDLFVQRMEHLLAQCREVNNALDQVDDIDRRIVSDFDRLDIIIADKLIDATLIGDDVSILQQLSVLVIGYRQSQLEMGKLHAERWPETYYSPLDMEKDPLITAINELAFRLRPLIASDPQIANLGRRVIKNLQIYQNKLLALNTAMVELKKRMLDVENTKSQASRILKKSDRDVVQAINAANTKVIHTFRITEVSLAAVSLALIAALIMLTAVFFRSMIKKPMDNICAGIKEIRSGNLDTRINLSRRDEWHLIEDALNTMAAALSSSYADLKKAQSFVSNIIDSMPSVLVGVDKEGVVTQWNRRTEEVTGISSENALSQPLDKVYPDLAGEMDRIKTAILDRRVLRDSKVRREDQNTTRYENVTIFPLAGDGMEGAVIRVDDITEQVRMEEMMIQSEKILSVGGLAAGMAHEINNPLAGMLQTAQVMAQRLKAGPGIPANQKAAQAAGITLESIEHYMKDRGIQRMIEVIISSGERVSQIVNNILSFARKEDAVAPAHHLAGIIDKTIELAATDYNLKKKYDFKRIEIIKEYDTDLPAVPCQATKIQQVILNILTNGAQAMQGAGTPVPRFIIRTRANPARDTACIDIEDNGPGMDKKTSKHIFDPFFTTKPVGMGTGLGLSVSYFIIAENHGGKITVESSPGKGAKFTICLPIRI